MISTSRLADVFVEVADTLVDDFDLVDFLDKLTEHVASVSGADAVGIVLADAHGALQFMSASNDAPGRPSSCCSCRSRKARARTPTGPGCRW